MSNISFGVYEECCRGNIYCVFCEKSAKKMTKIIFLVIIFVKTK